MNLLKLMQPGGRRLLTSDAYRQGLPAEDELAEYTEKHRRKIDLEPLQTVLTHVMEKAEFSANPSLSDGWLAPRIHATLRLYRREATDPGIWMYLTAALPEVRDYIVWRWPGLESERLTGGENRHALARLWWVAELARNGADYEPVTRAFTPQDVALRINDTNAYHNRAATLAFIQYVSTFDDGSPAGSGATQKLARAFNHGLTTNSLDALVPDPGPDPERMAEWVNTPPDETLMLKGLPEGPDDFRVSEEQIGAVTALMDHLLGVDARDARAPEVRGTRGESGLISVLIHRYDNEPAILDVEKRGYSDVYRRASSNDFQMVSVVPTTKAGTSLALLADAAGPQTPPTGGPPWPGRPDRYMVRVPVTNVRRTTVDRIRSAVLAAGVTWASQWTVKIVDLEEALLFGTDEEGTDSAE